jgi:hypothetical protein
MPIRTLLRILLLVALIPLILRRRERATAALGDGADPDGRFCGEEDAPDADEADDVLLDEDLLLDVNRASRAALLALPGFDGERADLVLRHRPFRSKHDLLRLGLVPEDVYRAIRDHIVARQAPVSRERA